MAEEWNNQLHILGTTRWLGPSTKYLQWCQYLGLKRLSTLSSSSPLTFIPNVIYLHYLIQSSQNQYEIGSFIFQMTELRFRGVLFHPSGHITGMLWRWESSWSLSLSYTIPNHMMSFVLMRQAFDISTHLHDRSVYVSPSFTANFCSNQPLCISVLLSGPSIWVNLFPLLHSSVIKLVLSLITTISPFLLSYFHQSFLTFSSLLCPSHASSW